MYYILVLLDASKAFDDIHYNVLFEINCVPVLFVLYYMYTHQQYYVKWNNERTNLFNVPNGVNMVA